MSASDIIAATHRSMAELRVHGREPVLIRIHPLDMETVIAEHAPGSAREAATSFLGLRVELDEAVRLGEPVAEWEPNRDSEAT